MLLILYIHMDVHLKSILFEKSCQIFIPKQKYSLRIIHYSCPAVIIHSCPDNNIPTPDNIIPVNKLLFQRRKAAVDTDYT